MAVYNTGTKYEADLKYNPNITVELHCDSYLYTGKECGNSIINACSYYDAVKTGLRNGFFVVPRKSVHGDPRHLCGFHSDFVVIPEFREALDIE